MLLFISTPTKSSRALTHSICRSAFCLLRQPASDTRKRDAVSLLHQTVDVGRWETSWSYKGKMKTGPSLASLTITVSTHLPRQKYLLMIITVLFFPCLILILLIHITETCQWLRNPVSPGNLDSSRILKTSKPSPHDIRAQFKYLFNTKSDASETALTLRT